MSDDTEKIRAALADRYPNSLGEAERDIWTIAGTRR